MKRSRLLPVVLAAATVLSFGGCGKQQNVGDELKNTVTESEETVTKPEEVKEEKIETESEEKEPETESEKETETETAEETEPTETEPAEETNGAPVHIPESELSDEILLFKTSDLNNNEITSDVFLDYDVTIFHIWATYCGPCIEEMGEYADLYRNLPENVNLCALVIDVYEGDDMNVDYANEILAGAGAEFTNLRFSEDLNELINSIDYVPSTVFVSRSGQIIGEILEGEPFEATIERLGELVG